MSVNFLCIRFLRLLPHRTGGDGDLFKSRPDRLDKYGHAPMAIDVGMYVFSVALIWLLPAETGRARAAC
jgi:hypothetical protein